MIARLKNRIEKVNWKYLISEILLIVIGINVGLWFNNLNDQRKEHKLETKILKEFVVSLDSDREDILSNIASHNDGLESCRRLLAYSEMDKNEQVMRDISSSYSWTFLVSDLSSYESLKSIGLQLVENDEIRRGITKLYNVDYKNVIVLEDNHRRRCDYFEGEIADLFEIEDNKYLISTNTQNIEQFKYIIGNLETTHSRVKNLYENDILPNVEALLLKIRADLK